MYVCVCVPYPAEKYVCMYVCVCACTKFARVRACVSVRVCKENKNMYHKYEGPCTLYPNSNYKLNLNQVTTHLQYMYVQQKQLFNICNTFRYDQNKSVAFSVHVCTIKKRIFTMMTCGRYAYAVFYHANAGLAVANVHYAPRECVL